MDIVIIGGGVVGLCIARELDRAGAKKITIIERGSIGQEASWAAAGMLAPNAEAVKFGDLYRFCVEANNGYEEFALELIEETEIDIELDLSGMLNLALSIEEGDAMKERYLRQADAGIEVSLLDPEQIAEMEPEVSGSAVCGLLYPNDGQVENRKLNLALKRFAEMRGVKILEHTEITELCRSPSGVTAVRTSNGAIEADVAILATGAWTSLIKLAETQCPLDVKPIKGQMIAFRPERRLIDKVVYSSRIYLVPRRDGRILAGATVEDVGFDKLVTEHAIMKLRDAAVELMPALENEEIIESWAGLRPFADGGAPVLGAIPGIDGVFIASGHYRNGILLGPLTGKLIAEEVLGIARSRYLDIFSPDRTMSGTALAA